MYRASSRCRPWPQPTMAQLVLVWSYIYIYIYNIERVYSLTIINKKRRVGNKPSTNCRPHFMCDASWCDTTQEKKKKRRTKNPRQHSSITSLRIQFNPLQLHPTQLKVYAVCNIPWKTRSKAVPRANLPQLPRKTIRFLSPSQGIVIDD